MLSKSTPCSPTALRRGALHLDGGEHVLDHTGLLGEHAPLAASSARAAPLYGVQADARRVGRGEGRARGPQQPAARALARRDCVCALVPEPSTASSGPLRLQSLMLYKCTTFCTRT